MDNLFTKRPTMKDAERTLKLAFSAAKRGDKRLAASRAVTAAVMAAIVSTDAAKTTQQKADRVIKDARALIQGIVISRVARKLSGALV